MFPTWARGGGVCAVMDLLTCFHIQVWGFVRGIRILHKSARIHRCRMHPPSELSGSTVVCESLVLEARLCIQFARWLRMRRMLCRFGDTFFAGSAETSNPREFATLASCSPFNDCRIIADVVHTCGHEVTS